MKERGAVLWDLDGTLVDSEEYHWQAWRDTMAARGHHLDRRGFAASFGKRNDTILRGLLGPDADAGEIRSIGNEKEERYRHLVRERGLELLPGAQGWLARLHEWGWGQALATSAPPANIEAVMQTLDIAGYLDAIASAEEVGQGKPDPAIFLLAASRLSVPPARCVVVEDAPAGLEGARRAGMRAIGVLSIHHSELRADLVVPTLEAIPEQAFEALVSRS